MAEFGKPTFYRYFEHQILNASLFSLRVDICLLVFGPDQDSLCSPDIEPVGVCHYAGMRQYIWRNAFWGETDWNRRDIRERINKLLRTADDIEFIRLRHIQELITLTFKSGAPSPTDGRPPLQDRLSIIINSIMPLDEHLIAKNKKKRYCRAVYYINKC